MLTGGYVAFAKRERAGVKTIGTTEIIEEFRWGFRRVERPLSAGPPSGHDLPGQAGSIVIRMTPGVSDDLHPYPPDLR